MSQYIKLTEEEKKLWKQAIDLALEALVKKGWDARNNSKKFDVLYKEHRIPPKEVIAYVFEYFDERAIETSIERVAGGEKDTNNLLRDLGLTILPKKRNLKEYLKEIDVWSGWRSSYGEFVPLFMQEAVTGKDWQEWDSKNFYEFFEKSNDQCVSSLKQGYFTSVEKSEIKLNWNKISPLLKDIVDSTESPSFVKYIELKKTIRKYTSQDRKAATNRLIASIQPNFLCTIVNQENLNTLISYLNKFVLNADIKTQSNWFENSHAVHSFFLKEGDFKDVYEMITYPWQLFEYFNGNHLLNDMSDQQISNEIIDLLKYKKQIILQGPPGTGKTREAKLIAEEILNSNDFNNSEQFKLVQFHPSYTYEDFVRGIVAESKGDKIEYKNVNKILGEFAERAVKNFKASSTNTPESNLDVWIDEKFEDFKNNIEAKLPEEETILSGDISVFEVNNDHFKYGKKWQTPGYLKFGEFKKLVKAVLQKEIEPAVASSKLNKEKFIHAHYRFTYYNALLTKFFNENIYEVPKEKIDLKNYVLIIDEINRANLSSVLGELIYALEYRGESVDSMYAIGEDNKLMLPPNLFIIGTMNTADRSVGHIDYAMRRRFAFVDVLPKDLSGEKWIVFDADLFAEVSSLFVKDFDLDRDYSKEKIERAATLSLEFDPKDVWLGHSYFIQQYEKDIDGKDDRHKPYDFNLRVEYEIKPILREYHKDGILIGDGIAEKIEALAASI